MQVFHGFSLKQAAINLRSSLLNNRAEFGTNIYEVKSQKYHGKTMVKPSKKMILDVWGVFCIHAT
jgi:hypothetical protein